MKDWITVLVLKLFINMSIMKMADIIICYIVNVFMPKPINILRINTIYQSR